MGPALRDEERGLGGDEEEVPTDSTLLLSSLTLKGTVAGQVGGVATVEVDAVQKDEPLPPTPAPVPSASLASAFEFMFCAAALQVSYLVWGVMQELIMNTKFNPTPKTPSGKFPSATFCVFSNRFLAIIVAAIVCRCIHGTVNSAAPLMQFTPCALSNTISSYSQYQALSFVSFSLQTLFKATKVIPVMVMGTVLKGTTYSVVEYVEALAITVGVAVFSLSKGGTHSNDTTTQLSGFLLLCSYVAADSFTSQWQSRIYRDYGKIDHYHMMYGVNVSSIIITVFAMIVSGEIPTVCEFLYYNPLALWYNVLTAITSTTGQIAIFYTIRKYGPIVFTVIMTTRQMLSIVLSTILFGHHIGTESLMGAIVVFLSVFHSIHRQVRDSKEKKAAKSSLPRPPSTAAFANGGEMEPASTVGAK